MSRPYLTVLTTPVAPPATRLYRRARAVLRPLIKPGIPLPPVRPYPGHHAVVRSVVEGLRAIGADFNFNPRSAGQVGRVVYAPANEALSQAMNWKRDSRIDYLVAGPVNALFLDDCDSILRRPELDMIIAPSEWTRWFYREAPELDSRVRICPVGVDQEYWKPTVATSSSRVVVYWKSGEERFCEQVERIIRASGLATVRLRSLHGEHSIFTPDDFRLALDGAVMSVFLSTFETQGIALAEAWAMNVPTLVWDPQGPAQWRGREFPSQSSAPFLTPATGVAWRSLDRFESVLHDALRDRDRFHPRAWVLANMTDAVCSDALYRIIRQGAEARRREP